MIKAKSAWVAACTRTTLATFLATIPGPTVWAQAGRLTSVEVPIGVPQVLPIVQPTTLAPILTSPAMGTMATAPILAASPIIGTSGIPATRTPRAAIASRKLPIAAASLRSLALRPAAFAAKIFDNAGIRKAASYLPAALTVAGVGATAYLLHHFGTPAASSFAPMALAGILSQNNQNSDDNPFQHRANLLLEKMREMGARPGQLVMKSGITRLAVDQNLCDEIMAKHLIQKLVENGRLLALSNDRYVLTSLRGLPPDNSANLKTIRALHLAQRGLQLISAVEKGLLTRHTLSTALFGEALKILKTDDSSFALSIVNEVEVLFKNAAYELLRDVLHELIDAYNAPNESNSLSEGTKQYRERLISIYNRLNTMYFGTGQDDPTFDPNPVIDAQIRAELSEILHRRITIPEEMRGIEMLRLLLEGKTSGQKIPDPKDPSQTFSDKGKEFYDQLHFFDRPGQLFKETNLVQIAQSLAIPRDETKQTIGELVAHGQLMALSSDHYVFTDLLSVWFKDNSLNEETRRGLTLALAGLAMFHNGGVPDVLHHGRATALLGDALEILKAQHAPVSIVVEVFFKNAAYEFLRDLMAMLLRHALGKGSSNVQQRTQAVLEELDALYFGIGLPDPALKDSSRSSLESFVGKLKRSWSTSEENREYVRGLDRLYLLLQGHLPGESQAPESPLLLAPPAGSTRFTPLEQRRYPTTLEFGTDLTQLAAEGRLKPVVGRDDKIEEMIETFTLVETNNPIVIGAPGVGKTALVEGLAQKIARGEAPPWLAGKHIVKIDLAAIVAGTKYRGEFEERLKKIMEEIQNSQGTVIPFIDEIHNLVGAGSAEGAMDAASILKEPLARGSLSLIGATTLDEYRKRIEKDGALARRFNPIMVMPPTPDEALAMLEGSKSVYEAQHTIKIGFETVKAAVEMAVRYITDRALPASAFNLMDKASAAVQIKAWKARVAGLEPPTEVTPNDIAEEVNKQTGITAGELTADKRTQLKQLPGKMKGRVIAQDKAVEAVAKAVQASELGYRDPNQPNRFLFLGPTGVGKTEVARALAMFLFGSEKNMTRIDMSEYMEKHAVSKLIGAPPGYVGYDEAGQLTERVRRRPYQVVLFDEIEKAHPDAFNLLLQILEDGRLTDSQGRTVDFSHTIIILTSNVGANLAGKGAKLGFESGSDQAQVASSERREKYLNEAKQWFRPEFLNRIGKKRIIVFNAITNKDDLNRILDLRIGDLNGELKGKGMTVSLTQAAREAILEEILAQPEYGARPIRQAKDIIYDLLTQDDLYGLIANQDHILVDWNQRDGYFIQKKEE